MSVCAPVLVHAQSTTSPTTSPAPSLMPDAATGMTAGMSYDRILLTTPASTNDEVGVAFLKMASNYPDFNKLVEDSPTYKKLDPLAQKDYLLKQVTRLQNAYLAFSPRRSALIVRVGVQVRYNRPQGGEASLDILTPAGGPIYFPYQFAQYPIALIPKDVDVFQHINLSAGESEIVYNRLGLDGAATLLLQVYPVAADDKTPVVMDNMPQYPMLSEIGYIGLLNTRAEQIWSWQSPKYNRKKISGGSDGNLIDLIPQKKP